MRPSDGAPISALLPVDGRDGDDFRISGGIDGFCLGTVIAGRRHQHDTLFRQALNGAFQYAVGRAGEAHIDDRHIAAFEIVERLDEAVDIGNIALTGALVECVDRDQLGARQQARGAAIGIADKQSGDGGAVLSAGSGQRRGREPFHFDPAARQRVMFCIDGGVDHADTDPAAVAGLGIVVHRRPADHPARQALARAAGVADTGSIIVIEIDGGLRRYRLDAGSRLSQRHPSWDAQAMDHPPFSERGLLENDIALASQSRESRGREIAPDQLGTGETQGHGSSDPAPFDAGRAVAAVEVGSRPRPAGARPVVVIIRLVVIIAAAIIAIIAAVVTTVVAAIVTVIIREGGLDEAEAIGAFA